MKSNTTILALAALVMTAQGCGGGEEPADVDAAQAVAPAPILGGERAEPAPVQSGADTEATAPDAVESQIPLRDSTPEEAVETYVTRYTAGDFAGAVEVCDPSSEGAVTLQKMVENLASAQKDDDVEFDLTPLLTQGMEGITWERTDENSAEDRVEFRLMQDGEQRKLCAAVLLDGVWRVQPDDSGSP